MEIPGETPANLKCKRRVLFAKAFRLGQNRFLSQGESVVLLRVN
jgi:hypothetical protein